MAKLIYGLNVSLDGYVDHDHPAFAPGPELFRHFIEQVRDATGALYGRGLYELVRIWDEDNEAWGEAEREYAAAWRKQRKWVASRTLTSVGPNAILLEGNLKGAVERLKAEHDGEIDVGGPVLAGRLTELGLIDAYRLYLHPVVLGHGRPFFTAARPRLRLAASEMIDAEVIRLTYVPTEEVA